MFRSASRPYQKAWPLFLAGGLLTILLFLKAKNKGKGNLPQRYNNPFAIRQKNPDPWLGLKGVDNRGFLIFKNPVFGTRAGFINLKNAYLNRGINTIEKIFPVYAPAGDGQNDPEVYIRNVVKFTGIPRDKVISTKEEIYEIGKAIVRQEEGYFWVTEEAFKQGFKLAL